VKSHGKLRVRKLQHEISVLENIISKETCMCNSLRENMRHPINVHRWRVLEVNEVKIDAFSPTDRCSSPVTFGPFPFPVPGPNCVRDGHQGQLVVQTLD